MAGEPMKVAVALLTYNRCDYLERTISSLADAGGEYDIFVYDNGSTDETRRYLANCAEFFMFEGLGFNNTDNHTAGYGMNRVIEMARGAKPDIILFTADDYRYRKGWFAKFLDFWTHAPDDVKLASLNIEPAYQWNAITERVEYGGQRAIIRATVGGSNWSFRADDLDLIYPLREITGGEDLEICRRLTGNGHRIAALNLTDHIGEFASCWGNRSWEYAQPLPADIREWVEINDS